MHTPLDNRSFGHHTSSTPEVCSAACCIHAAATSGWGHEPFGTSWISEEEVLQQCGQLLAPLVV